MASISNETVSDLGRNSIPATQELLASILNVLQRLDSRMDEQNKSIQALAQRFSSDSSKHVHIERRATDTYGSENHGELLRPGTPPRVVPEPLPEKNEPFIPKQKNRIHMPPSILADNKHQRDQFKEAFSQSPFGEKFPKTEKFATASKLVKSLIKDQPGPIQIFVENEEGDVNQIDYTNDKDEAYLGSRTLSESGSRSTATTAVGNSGSELNLAAIQTPRTRYAEFPAPSAWIPGTRTLARDREPMHQTNLTRTGKIHLGTLWAAPPDGRVDFVFQSHHLKWLGREKGMEQIIQTSDLLQLLDNMEKNIRWDPSLLIEDYGLSSPSTPIQYLRTVQKTKTSQEEVSLVRHPGSSSRAGEYMAPWKRIVQLKGFSKLPDLIAEDHQSLFQDVSSDEPRAPGPSFSQIFVSDRKKYHDNILRMLAQDTVEKHVTCSRDSRVRLQIPKFLTINYMNFHVTFFELITSASTTGDSSWKTGKLYSDEADFGSSRLPMENMFIRESACTILFIIDEPQYWTALYMRPETFKRYIRSTHAEAHDDSIAADLLIQATACVVAQWEAIEKHLKGFIVDHHLLLDPEGHDRLLFDDDSFSRSRKYFWVINFLAECDSRIDENLQEINLAMSEAGNKLDHLFPPDGSYTGSIRYMDEKISKLQEIQGKLRSKRSETIALRDGLFSASAVMESRASTRLGENVKLLTFVSIFFVPLSFCTSLWSINDQILSLPALAITITFVALSTYLIVFNLNTLVNISKTIYRERRNKLIGHMTKDADAAWQEEGRRFKSFQPRMKREKPSEWRLVVYVLAKLGSRLVLSDRVQTGHGNGKFNAVEVKKEVGGNIEDNIGREEAGEEGAKVRENDKQKASDPVAENVPRKKSHSLVRLFSRNRRKGNARAEEV